MDRSNITPVIDKIKAAIENHAALLEELIAQGNKKIAGYISPVIPPEIPAAFDIELLKIPEDVISGYKPAAGYEKIYSALILPDQDISCFTWPLHSTPLFRCSLPEGYGEDAAVSLHNSISSMLGSLFGIDIKSIDIKKLQQKTGTFEAMRRTVRTITSLRSENSDILSAAEISMILEVAAIFPPDVALGYLAPLSEELKKISGGERTPLLKALFSGGRSIPNDIAGFIEDNGIAIIEDDTCAGRRLFDVSLNAGSEFLFYELLDAYTYRPGTPCTRRAGERYELLYKLLRNYGIGLVILFDDRACGCLPEHIEFLRIRLMRDGVDPLVINRENYTDVVSRYLSLI